MTLFHSFVWIAAFDQIQPTQTIQLEISLSAVWSSRAFFKIQLLLFVAIIKDFIVPSRVVTAEVFVCSKRDEAVLVDFLQSKAAFPNGQSTHVLLAPGAMGAMDHSFLNRLSECLVARHISVSRFEFAYMAARRTGGSRRPPPRAEALLDEYREAVKVLKDQLSPDEQVIIGGKSLGGRVASMVADGLYISGMINGLVCVGYPFHPARKPDKLRTAHLAAIACPALIIQGDRDPLGTRKEVGEYTLDPRINICWMPDGDHDLLPRKRSGQTQHGNIEAAADAIADFAGIISAAKTGNPEGRTTAMLDDPDFASTPEPPYYVVIFSAKRTEGDCGYAAMADRMMELAISHPGCLGAESARNANGFGVTNSYWRDEASILAWKANAEHVGAQVLGQERWYSHYEMRIAKVERAYSGPLGRPSLRR